MALRPRTPKGLGEALLSSAELARLYAYQGSGVRELGDVLEVLYGLLPRGKRPPRWVPWVTVGRDGRVVWDPDGYVIRPRGGR